MTALSAAQQRYLAEIQAAGAQGRRYNGRAAKPLEALERLGLIGLDFDLLPQVKGNGLEFVQRFTAVAK